MFIQCEVVLSQSKLGVTGIIREGLLIALVQGAGKIKLPVVEGFTTPVEQYTVLPVIVWIAFIAIILVSMLRKRRPSGSASSSISSLSNSLLSCPGSIS